MHKDDEDKIDLLAPHLRAIESGEFDDPEILKNYRLAIAQQVKDGLLSKEEYLRLNDALLKRGNQ